MCLTERSKLFFSCSNRGQQKGSKCQTPAPGEFHPRKYTIWDLNWLNVTQICSTWNMGKKQTSWKVRDLLVKKRYIFKRTQVVSLTMRTRTPCSLKHLQTTHQPTPLQKFEHIGPLPTVNVPQMMSQERGMPTQRLIWRTPSNNERTTARRANYLPTRLGPGGNYVQLMPI